MNPWSAGRARAQRSRALESLRSRPNLYRLLAIATIPPRDLVQERAWLADFLQAKPYTMLPFERMKGVRRRLCEVEGAGVPGSIVQLGVWRGGSAAILAAALPRPLGRDLWLFDSWEGQPPPTEGDVTDLGEAGRAGMFRASEDDVRAVLFRGFHLPPGRVHLVRGWFDRTIPAQLDALGPVAFLHIDCDFYEPVRLSLESVVPLVSPGGVIVVDDYGAWEGCRRAVDEFVARRSDVSALEPIDDSAVSFRRVLPAGGTGPAP